MGCSASVSRPTSASGQIPNHMGWHTTAQTHPSEGLTLMNPLEWPMNNDNIFDNNRKRKNHIIDIMNPPFARERLAEVQCGDTLEFNVTGNGEYDVMQVYRDGHHYYRIDGGIRLFNIKNNTPRLRRREEVRLALNEDVDIAYLYFCVTPSSQRERILTNRRCPTENCEANYLIVRKRLEKIYLTDQNKNQKVYLNIGDTIEIEWSSESGNSYHIIDKLYCPISAGLYTPQSTSLEKLSNGKIYRNTFKQIGTLFLLRLNQTNQIHDITVCIVKDKYDIKYIKINDDPEPPYHIQIKPNIIRIEQYHWIIFQWDTKQETTITQIEPFHTDQNQQSIELKETGKHFFWPYQPTRRGCIIHQFKQTGLFTYKTGNNQIGTIIVQPQTIIRQLTLFNDKLIHQIKTNDAIQFNWKMTDSQGEPILITIDSNASKISHTLNHTNKKYDVSCDDHKCKQIEPYFRYHFHTCETFILNLYQYGLYNFSYSNNPDNALLSVIVQKGNDIRRVNYDGENLFKPLTMTINRHDQVEFVPLASTNARRICQTDEYGYRLQDQDLLFEPQENSLNYFMKQFSHVGIYYFSTRIENFIDSERDKDKDKQSKITPLAIIVLPEICFHEKIISKGKFDSEITITTNRNDFIIWKFDQLITCDLIQLYSNETFKDIISSHQRVIPGKKRQCIALDCQQIPIGAAFFSNPDFERVFGSYQDRLISTVIVDPLFSQNSFMIINQRFYPKILYIEQNDTISFILENKQTNFGISIQLESSDDDEYQQNVFIDRQIEKYVDGIYYLHTFNQLGEYQIRSNRFSDSATVIVYSKIAIKDQEKEAQKPQIVQFIRSVSEYNTQIHLRYPYRQNASIFYTIDGSIPTQQRNNVQLYDPHEGIRLRQPGLCLIRSYATEHQKLSSFVTTSSPTFVLDNQLIEASWDGFVIKVSASFKYPKKLNGKIEIEPRSSIDLISHFHLYINDILQKTIILSKDLHFTVDINQNGNKYRIHVIAYPKKHLNDAQPVTSNRITLEDHRQLIDSRTSNQNRRELSMSRDINDDGRFGLSSDSKDRAHLLLVKLSRTIESRSMRFQGSCIHPHTHYPGMNHYQTNQLLTESSTILNEHFHPNDTRTIDNDTY